MRITEKWEFDKKNMEIETQLMKHRQELEIAKFRQKIELAKIGGLCQSDLQELEADDADDDDEGNINNNAQVQCMFNRINPNAQIMLTNQYQTMLRYF